LYRKWPQVSNSGIVKTKGIFVKRRTCALYERGSWCSSLLYYGIRKIVKSREDARRESFMEGVKEVINKKVVEAASSPITPRTSQEVSKIGVVQIHSSPRGRPTASSTALFALEGAAAGALSSNDPRIRRSVPRAASLKMTYNGRLPLFEPWTWIYLDVPVEAGQDPCPG
jgi:hypothetical protein